MNKIIRDQLNKTRIPLPAYNDGTLVIQIPKAGAGATKSSNDVIAGKIYMLYIENYIIHEPDGFTLSTNFNQGTKPDDNKVYAQPQKFMGKMVYVSTKGVNTGTVWNGWLPRKGFTIIQEIDAAGL